MGSLSLLRRLPGARRAKTALLRLLDPVGQRQAALWRDAYSQDGLKSVHNHDFMTDPDFVRAYARGVEAAADYRWHWRVHVGLWAAATAVKVEGDFVECGVGHGFLSSAIMEYLDWNSLDRRFFLLDTFAGLDERSIPDAERTRAMAMSKALLESGVYASDSAAVREHFARWERVEVIEGAIPATLSQITADRIAYLHIDMNCSPPEVAALETLWPRVSPGGVVLLDDYGYKGFESQKGPMDRLAKTLGARILSLPTGQGLLIR